MRILEVVFGDSCLMSMRKSNMSTNDILLFNVLFNIGDISSVDKHFISVPNEIIYEEANYKFDNEYNIIIDAIKNNKKIRVWTSHFNIYSYLVLLYISDIIYKNNYELYVCYSDELDDKFVSPSIMNSNFLNELENLEHKLSVEEIKSFSKIWNDLVDINSNMRILEDGFVKSVNDNYYDNLILQNLKSMGEVKESRLVGSLMGKVYLNDNLYVYLIDKLIERKKIKIISLGERVFDNIISINL